MKKHLTAKIKALSVNQVWRGRRFKTPKYKAYEQELSLLLPNQYYILTPTIDTKIGEYEGMLGLVVKFGVSSKKSDVDNLLKPFIDICCKKWDFDDREIYSIWAVKENVKKGNEFIKFNFEAVI